MLPRLMLVRERDATIRQTQPEGWVALVSGGQGLRDHWIRVELSGVEHAVERTAGSPALAAAAHCDVRRDYAQRPFMTTGSEISENKKIEYEQVCESHCTITDFRAKFLALLPIASGTGLFLVFKDCDKALSTPQMNAIGWLGLAAIVGLPTHEYHTRLLGSYEAGSRIGTGFRAWKRV